MISCLHDHFLDDQLLPTPHLYFLNLQEIRAKQRKRSSRNGAGSMTFYAYRVTDKTLFGMTLTAAQFGADNSFFIFSLASLFAMLWIRLGRRGWEPSTPVKFSLGITQAGLGFGALVYGAQFPDETGVVSAWSLIAAYLLHTMVELCLSSVGLRQSPNSRSHQWSV